MYLRTTARANKDGSVVRYLALAHNQRVGAATKANVLLNLGREDRLDPDGLRRLVRSINRYLGEPDIEGTDAPAATGADTNPDGLRLICSRPAGAAWLLHGLWKALDVSTALRKVLGGARTRRANQTMTATARRRAEQAAARRGRAPQGRMRATRTPRARALAAPDPSGRLVLDRAKISAEAKLDGKYLLSTSDPDLSAEDVALGYKNLLEAERGFRDLKSTIELRPVFHRLEPRIRAHVLLCWLALLLIRVAERRTDMTWRHIARELARLHAITLTGPAGTVVQTTEPTTAQMGILRACGLAPPPRITTLDPT